MAASSSDDENGNGNRVTVALIGEKVDSLTKLSELKFKGLQRQLDAVTALSSVVADHGTRLAVLEQAIATMRKDRENDERSAVTSRQFVLGVLAIVVALVVGLVGGHVG